VDVDRPVDPTPRVTFLANAGVQVELAGSTILVDALFDLNFAPDAPPSRYSHLDPVELDRLERGVEPFRCADFVLVTHGHDDHASRASVLRHLQYCTDAELFVAAGSWTDEEPPLPTGRVHPVAVPRGRSLLVADAEVRIEALGYRHGTRTGTEPAHVGWLLAGGGVRILHLGDATPTPDNLHDFGGALMEPVDLALVPHWFVTHEGGWAWLVDELQPRRIAVLHVVEKDPRVMEGLAAVAARHPDLIVLTRPFEQIEIRPGRTR
jgi:L-ascorbate metabolism protein UlaG (beta-lactamase superfamily)